MDESSDGRYAYIRRRGRITKGQERALSGLRDSWVVDATAIEQTKSPLGIEIGFGMGHAVLSWAQQAPDWSIFGVELYEPGVGAVLSGIERCGIINLRVLMQPAQEVLAKVPDGLVQEIRIFFPDPWPKKRHHKRRLIQPAFVSELARVVRPGGLVRLATDWAPYAEWMTICFAQCPELIPQPAELVRDTTNFERRGERLGHRTFDFQFVRSERD